MLAAIAAIIVTLGLSLVAACAVAVRASTSPARAIVGAPPPGIGARTVAVPSSGGQAPRGIGPLAAWFVPGRSGRGAVLLVHGIRADRRVLASRMVFLARAAFAVLALDLRAHGESAGNAITFGKLEADDVVAAVGWLRAEVPDERVGVLGISLGGAAAALASRRVALDALILESVFPDLRAAVRNRVRGLAGPAARVVSPMLLAVGARLTRLRLDDLKPIEALASYAGPVFILSGAEDRHTTLAETRALHAAVPGEKHIWEIAGAGHVDMARAAGQDYQARILAFLGRHLDRTFPPCA